MTPYREPGEQLPDLPEPELQPAMYPPFWTRTFHVLLLFLPFLYWAAIILGAMYCDMGDP